MLYFASFTLAFMDDSLMDSTHPSGSKRDQHSAPQPVQFPSGEDRAELVAISERLFLNYLIEMASNLLAMA